MRRFFTYNIWIGGLEITEGCLPYNVINSWWQFQPCLGKERSCQKTVCGFDIKRFVLKVLAIILSIVIFYVMWLCFSIDIYCLSSNLNNALFQSLSQCLPRYYRNEENLCGWSLKRYTFKCDRKKEEFNHTFSLRS